MERKWRRLYVPAVRDVSVVSTTSALQFSIVPKCHTHDGGDDRTHSECQSPSGKLRVAPQITSIR
jgi:hypothetical protein